MVIASAGPACTSFIVLKTVGIQYAKGGIDGVFVGVLAVIVAVRPLLLIGDLCAVITGCVCLIQAADCCVGCKYGFCMYKVV